MLLFKGYFQIIDFLTGSDKSWPSALGCFSWYGSTSESISIFRILLHILSSKTKSNTCICEEMHEKYQWILWCHWNSKYRNLTFTKIIMCIYMYYSNYTNSCTPSTCTVRWTHNLPINRWKKLEIYSIYLVLL